MFKRSALLILSLLFVACTNATPEVSFLNQPSLPAPPKVQTETFASTDLAGAKEVTDPVLGYSAKVLIQSGTHGTQVKSADGYVLENRHLSF